MQDVNSITLVGRLTRDPESRNASVTSLRLAFTQSRKVDGAWVDEPGYVDVTVFGSLGETCQRFLNKGRQVVVLGRLDHREWEKDGQRRSALQIVANQVQFIGGREGDSRQPAQQSAQPALVGATVDNIPF